MARLPGVDLLIEIRKVAHKMLHTTLSNASFNKDWCILIKISLNFVFIHPIDTKSVLVQAMRLSTIQVTSYSLSQTPVATPSIYSTISNTECIMLLRCVLNCANVIAKFILFFQEWNTDWENTYKNISIDINFAWWRHFSFLTNFKNIDLFVNDSLFYCNDRHQKDCEIPSCYYSRRRKSIPVRKWLVP